MNLVGASVCVIMFLGKETKKGRQIIVLMGSRTCQSDLEERFVGNFSNLPIPEGCFIANSCR